MTNWRKVRTEIETRFSSYVLGVSGGVDSQFLLYFLTKCNTQFIAVHFHHGNRFEEDDADEQFVREQCAQLGVKLFVGYGDREKILNARSIEQECRNQRYEFMLKIKEDHQYDRLMTAHNADEQCENVLLRLLRGTSFDKLQMKFDNSWNFRPLLEVEKAEIIKKCTTRRIPWREDPTNADNRFERNWVRNVLIPVINERRKANRIAKTANMMNRDEEKRLLAELAEIRLDEAV